MKEPLSKSDKKAARTVIDLALQRDYNSALNEYQKILAKWKAEEPAESKSTYLSLYKAIEKNDKYISSRYDGLSGSRYFMTVVGLINDKVLLEEDLTDFSAETRQDLLTTAKCIQGD